MGRGKLGSLGNMLSIITRMPQGATLPPGEASVATCNFDEHSDRKGFLLLPPYPRETGQIHNLLFKNRLGAVVWD